jgi:DNA invertase Pin-like site-specific DNA recombinase
LDETFKPDAGVSGYSGDNLRKGSLAAFLAAVEQNRVKTPCVLVVEALDRLTRTRLRDARKLFDGLLEKGVQICTANNAKLYDDSSLDNPIDLFMSLIELNAAHLYSKTISQRVRAAWARKKQAASKGVLLTAKTPAWIKADRVTNKATLIPEKAAVLKRIFNSYLDGKGSRVIMKELNKDMIPSFGRGQSWNTTHIDRLLHSGTVIGEYQPKKHFSKTEHELDGVAIPDYYPAAIDKQLFYKVQKAIKDRSCPQWAKGRSHSLLTSTATCSQCGKRLVYVYSIKPTNGKIYSWLKCDSAVRVTGCKAPNISYPQIERGILTLLSIYIVLQVNSSRRDSSQLNALQAELTHTQARMSKLKAMLNDPNLISKAVLQTLRELETQEEELKAKIAIAPPPGGPNPFSNWKPLAQTPDNRIKLRMILKQAIESLVIDTDAKTARLTLRGLPTNLSLKWAGPKQRRDEAGVLEEKQIDKFYINDKEQPYLDNVVIWESAENIKDQCKLMDVVLRCAISNITMNADISKPKKSKTVKPSCSVPCFFRELFPFDFRAKREAVARCCGVVLSF